MTPQLFKPQALKQSAGFTLIEVLLAMAITVFVAVMAYSGLSSAITAAEVNEQHAERMAEIQLALTVIERDIRHAARRGIVDEYGDEQAALFGGPVEDYPLQLTRYGWDNPRDLVRGEIQRLRYLLEEQQLWRESWSVLDRMTEEDSLQRLMLLDGVSELSLRFLDPLGIGAERSPLGGEWQEEWPAQLPDNPMPLAIEVTLEIEGFGQVRRIFEVVSVDS